MIVDATGFEAPLAATTLFLPAGWNSQGGAWRLNDGSYVLTNDANFQPNRDLGVEGQQLEQTR